MELLAKETTLTRTPPPLPKPGLLRAIPIAVLLAALCAALLHIAPFWHSWAKTPPGWQFTWNIHDSPDFIQYRVWMRLSPDQGVFVSDNFTSEANRPHLPVLLYYVFGHISRATDFSPEAVMAFAGSLLAFAFTILLFAVVQLFLGSSYRTWWVFLLLFGGGLGAHLKFLARFDLVRQNFVTKRLIVEPLFNPQVSMVFEDYRGHYVFTTLFDTHHLANWLVATLAVLSLYFALRHFTVTRVMLVAFLYALAAFMHIYEAATLCMITAAVALFCWRKNLLRRRDWISLAAGPLAAVATLGVLLFIQRSSGLPFPPWRALGIYLSMLILAYPLAWLVIGWGLVSYWKSAGLAQCFLLGWATGCTLLTLSAPFYPYPDRGTMTLQIPIYVMAGMIYFARYTRVTKWAALLAIGLAAATPCWLVLRWVSSDPFRPNAPHVFTSPAHREILDFLSSRASATDILAADPEDLLWIAPQYPGKHYVAHFFLTVNFDRKKTALTRFLGGSPQQQATFLEKERIRFLYLSRAKEPPQLSQVDGLRRMKTTSAGSVFEYSPPAASP